VPARCVERDFIDILDENFRPTSQGSVVRAAGKEWKRVPMAHPIDLNAVETRARRAVGPAATEQAHFVSFRGEPPEDLVEMDFGAARQGILAILPVHEKDAHYIRPIRRASASSTPLTNFALLSVPYRSAKSTAS